VATTDLAHSVSSICSAPASHAFSYLADPMRLGEWALGCWGAVASGPGIVKGTSLFDGVDTFARPLPHDRQLLVDYEVGDAPERLVRRITVRVIPGDALGEPPSRSLVVLTGWRVRWMDDERWRQLVVAHEAEVLLLRHRIETSGS
jgi:hypothetical protein